MLSTIAKTSLTGTAAGDQKDTAAVTNQKARLFTVAPSSEYPPVNDSKDVFFPEELSNLYIQLLLNKGASQVIKEVVKRDGDFIIGSDGLRVQVYTSGFEHKDLKIDIINGLLVVQGVTTDLMGKTLQCNKQIWIPTSDKYDKENLKAESKNGLLKVFVSFINKEKA